MSDIDPGIHAEPTPDIVDDIGILIEDIPPIPMPHADEVVPPPDPSEEPSPLLPESEPVTVSIEDYEAARETLVASGDPNPDDAAIVVAAVEAQTGNLPPIDPIEENNV